MVTLVSATLVASTTLGPDGASSTAAWASPARRPCSTCTGIDTDNRSRSRSISPTPGRNTSTVPSPASASTWRAQ